MKGRYLFYFPILMTILLFGCSLEKTSEKKVETFKVKTSKVVKRSFSSEESYVGNIKSKNTINISTKMMGRIIKLYVQEGSVVKKGQLLVEVDASEAVSAYRQAEAGLNAATVAAENAERDYERFKRLFENKAVTKHQLEQMEAMVASARAQKEQAKANLDMTKNLLSYGKIFSPSDGVITKKFLEEGNIASPGMPIITLENPDSLEIYVEVAEEKASKIPLNSKAKLFKNEEGNFIQTNILAIVQAAEPYTKTSTIKLEVPKEGNFKPGQFVKVRFDALSKEFLSIPKSAVKKEGQVDLIFVRTPDSKSHLRIIKAGRTEGDFVQILAGANEGEEVVLSPPDALKEGDILEVLQ